MRARKEADEATKAGLINGGWGMRVVGNVSSTVRAQLRKASSFSIHMSLSERGEGGSRVSWVRETGKVWHSWNLRLASGTARD
jgi:hypothetical protein